MRAKKQSFCVPMNTIRVFAGAEIYDFSIYDLAYFSQNRHKNRKDANRDFTKTGSLRGS